MANTGHTQGNREIHSPPPPPSVVETLATTDVEFRLELQEYRGW
jgi:hypothetical protein